MMTNAFSTENGYIRYHNLLLSMFQDEVVLIDFNPFGPVTDSLLFDWEELTSCDVSQVRNSPLCHLCVVAPSEKLSLRAVCVDTLCCCCPK